MIPSSPGWRVSEFVEFTHRSMGITKSHPSMGDNYGNLHLWTSLRPRIFCSSRGQKTPRPNPMGEEISLYKDRHILPRHSLLPLKEQTTLPHRSKFKFCSVVYSLQLSCCISEQGDTLPLLQGLQLPYNYFSLEAGRMMESKTTHRQTKIRKKGRYKKDVKMSIMNSCILRKLLI